MKCLIPEISWHNRDPILSVDFQPKRSDLGRLATGGTDSHVVIWYINIAENGAITFEAACDLTRHQRAVNVVRWSACGNYLASGDDESVIIVWKQKTDADPPPLFDQSEELQKETWVTYKTLRGHMEDVYDLSWCPSSNFLVSGSVDNSAILWDLHKAQPTILHGHKGFVQGVSWDPSNQYIVTMSSDRTFRAFDIANKKMIARSSKVILPLPENHRLHNVATRLYHDDTLQTFCRRLHFSPNGELIAVPTGFLENDQNGGSRPVNAAYIYSRFALKTPVCVLPCGDHPALAVRWSPITYKVRENGPPSIFPFSKKRFILAVVTRGSVIFYDTQQKKPFAMVSNIHYTRLTDLSWSSDGKIVLVSSTDGYCSVICFSEGELGDIYSEPNDTSENMNVD